MSRLSSHGSLLAAHRRKALLAASVAAAMAMLSGAAHADFMFDAGNDPQPNEQNIQFEQLSGPLTSLVGDTNMTNTPVTFDIPTSPNTSTLKETGIGTDGKGQADIVCVTVCGTDSKNGADGMQLEDLEIKLGPGLGATDFIGNLDFGEGTFDINVVDQNGMSFDYTLGKGENFFTLTAINGEVITDIQILGETADSNGNIGFNDFKQPRISGLCTLVGTTCTAIPVPEPSSLALFGAGLVAAGWFASRRKARCPA